jgi:hypothetical protein
MGLDCFAEAALVLHCRSSSLHDDMTSKDDKDAG